MPQQVRRSRRVSGAVSHQGVGVLAGAIVSNLRLDPASAPYLTLLFRRGCEQSPGRTCT